MNTLEKAIEKALQPLQREKTGANFQKLPIRYQNSIDSNLKLSDTMYQYLSENPKNPNNMTDETALFKGDEFPRQAAAIAQLGAFGNLNASIARFLL